MINDEAFAEFWGAGLLKQMKVIEMIHVLDGRFIKPIELDAGYGRFVNDAEFEGEHILFGYFLQLEAMQNVILEFEMRISPADCFIGIGQEIDGRVFDVRQLNKLIAVFIVGCECIPRSVVAVVVDEKHVAIVGTERKHVTIRLPDVWSVLRFSQDFCAVCGIQRMGCTNGKDFCTFREHGTELNANHVRLGNKVVEFKRGGVLEKFEIAGFCRFFLMCGCRFDGWRLFGSIVLSFPACICGHHAIAAFAPAGSGFEVLKRFAFFERFRDMPKGNLNASGIRKAHQQGVVPESIGKGFVVDDSVDKAIQRIGHAAFAGKNGTIGFDVRFCARMRAVGNVAHDQVKTDKIRIL